MKNKVHPIRFLAAVIAIAFVVMSALFVAQSAHAQPPIPAVNPLTPAAPETAPAVSQPNPPPDVAGSFIGGLAGAHPWFVTLAAIMGAFRLIFKPIVSAAESYVRSTPSTADDAFVEKVEHSAAFKSFAWCLDWIGSIKIGPQFTAKPKAES